MKRNSFQPEGGVFPFVPLVMLVLTLASGVLVAPLAAEAQPPPKIPRIGVLSGSSLATDSRNREAFLQGLRELGYVEGRTIVLEGRWAEGKRERLPALAAELVRLRVEVIVAGNVPAAMAASQATQHIPIVLAGGDVGGGRGSSPTSRGRAETSRGSPSPLSS